MVSTLEQMQVPNGTGPGVRRSKRPLLASRTQRILKVKSREKTRQVRESDPNNWSISKSQKVDGTRYNSYKSYKSQL